MSAEQILTVWLFLGAVGLGVFLVMMLLVYLDIQEEKHRPLFKYEDLGKDDPRADLTETAREYVVRKWRDRDV